MSIDEREPEYPPSAGDAWTTLQTLHECVVRALACGDDYDLLLSASRDAEALLARYALTISPGIVSVGTLGSNIAPSLRVSRRRNPRLAPDGVFVT